MEVSLHWIWRYGYVKSSPYSLGFLEHAVNLFVSERRNKIFTLEKFPESVRSSPDPQI